MWNKIISALYFDSGYVWNKKAEIISKNNFISHVTTA